MLRANSMQCSHLLAQSGNIPRSFDDTLSAILVLIQLVTESLEHWHEGRDWSRGLHIDIVVARPFGRVHCFVRIVKVYQMASMPNLAKPYTGSPRSRTHLIPGHAKLYKADIFIIELSNSLPLSILHLHQRQHHERAQQREATSVSYSSLSR